MKNAKKTNVSQELSDLKVDKTPKMMNPLLKLAVKFSFLCLVVATLIYYSDSKGYFEPDQKNNHTIKKWETFYEFTEKNNVDVVLLGNSHLYTGINPKNLSATLGVNSFILASPGTNVADTYFGLKEALKRINPSLVVIETYGMNEFDLNNLSEGSLSEQFKSFSARKDIATKLFSTPQLFRSKDYLYAWSNTIRNHDFIFTNPLQLEKNKEIIKAKENQKIPSNKQLYLGRYVRFTTGIEDSILNRYKTEGAPVDGAKYKYTSDTKKYIDKIVQLCQKENIQLIFLTLPMYKDHIKNYAVWKSKLGELITPHSVKWLDMQEPYSADFGPIAFENAYQENQHMTYQGSLLATYKLAEFIKTQPEIKLPNRKAELLWYNTFYGEEGFFENNSPSTTDKNNRIISQDKKFSNVQLSQVLMVDVPQKPNVKNLIAKVDRALFKSVDPKTTELILTLQYMENNQMKSFQIALNYDYLHTPTEFALFSKAINFVDIKDVIEATVVRITN